MYIFPQCSIDKVKPKRRRAAGLWFYTIDVYDAYSAYQYGAFSPRLLYVQCAFQLLYPRLHPAQGFLFAQQVEDLYCAAGRYQLP